MLQKSREVMERSSQVGLLETLSAELKEELDMPDVPKVQSSAASTGPHIMGLDTSVSAVGKSNSPGP